jgi:hypothetical protein
MFTIAISLLIGWILSLFGFKAVVILGMAQVFGVTITSTGYYFLFGLWGALRSVALLSRSYTVNPFQELQERAKKLQKTRGIK